MDTVGTARVGTARGGLRRAASTWAGAARGLFASLKACALLQWSHHPRAPSAVLVSLMHSDGAVHMHDASLNVFCWDPISVWFLEWL